MSDATNKYNPDNFQDRDSSFQFTPSNDYVIYSKRTALERYQNIEARKKFDDFINKASNLSYYLHSDKPEDNLKAQEIIEFERGLFKLHLKVPIDLKSKILQVLLSNGSDANFPDFKVYKDQIEMFEDRKDPTGGVSSFVFYFQKTGDEEVRNVFNRLRRFYSFLYKLLESEGIYQEIPENIALPRFSYQLKKEGSPINGFSIVQGDGDFKNRCLFYDKDVFLDKTSNYAFFAEDSEFLKDRLE